MKRQLRISGLQDYIAVDMVNERGVILSTPFYLKYNSMGKLKYKEDLVSRMTNVFLVGDGEKLTHLIARDSEGFDFNIPFSELSESHIQFIQP